MLRFPIFGKRGGKMSGATRYLRLFGLFFVVVLVAGSAGAQTDPDSVEITLSNPSATEGDDLVFGASVNCIWLDPSEQDLNYTIKLTLETKDGTAVGGNPNSCSGDGGPDYEKINNVQVTFVCGANSSIVTVTTCANDEDDGDRTFTLQRNLLGGGGAPPELTAFNNGTGTILDDDDPLPPDEDDDEDEDEDDGDVVVDPGLSTVKISLSQRSIREDATADITITRTGSAAQMQMPASGQVDFVPSGGNASRRDILSIQNLSTGEANCNFSFAATSASKQSVVCRVSPDFGATEKGLDDPEERFVFKFAAVNGANKGGSQTLTIRDVDGGGGGGGGGDEGDDDDDVDQEDGPVVVDLASAFGEGTPQRAVAGALQSACRSSANTEIRTFCRYLRDDLDGGSSTTPADGQRAQVVREITPVDLAAMADTMARGTRGQLENWWERMRQVRRGAREKVGAKLSMNLGGQGVLLDSSAIRAALEQEEEWDPLAGLFSPMPAVQDAGGSGGYGAVDTSPVRYFVTGRFSMGSHDETDLEEGWDLDSAELSVGVDKIFGDAVLLGGGLGYFSSETEFDGDGGAMDTRSFSLGLYSMYYYGRFFVSGTLGYGDGDYQSIRRVHLPQAFRGVNILTPRATPSGTQSYGSATFGWDRKKDKSAIGVFLRGSWSNVEIDGYTETDGGPANLVINDQELQSLIGELGIDLAYSAEYRWGVMRPSLRVSAMKEFEDASRLIGGIFDLDTVGHGFFIRTDEPDEEFFRAGAGLTFAFFNGGSLYVFYDTEIGRDDHEFDTITAGLNLDF